MSRIDPGQARRQESTVVRGPVSLQVDVGQDEARKDEEDIHAQARAVQQARALRRERPVELEVEQHDAEGEKEPHARERIEHVGEWNPRGPCSVAHVFSPDDRARPGRSLVSTRAMGRPLVRGWEGWRVWQMGCDAGAQ